MGSFPDIVDLATQVLGGAVSSHEVHASNIANVKTANYKNQEPSFQVVFDKAQALSEGARVLNRESPLWSLETQVRSKMTDPDVKGNTVKLDQEMSAMTENSMLYMATLKILNKEIAITRYAITSGGGI